MVILICLACTRNNSLWKIILVCNTFNISQTIQFVVILFYYWLMHMTGAILNNIKENCLAFTTEHLHREGFTTPVVRRPNRNFIVPLKQLELIYMNTIEIKCEINDVFEAPIIFIMIQMFHALVTNTHMAYHGTILEATFSVNEFCIIALWTIFQIIKVYAFASCGELLKLEANEIAQVLYNIPTDTHTVTVMTEVQHFSSVISCLSPEVTIYGFFPLDATLLFNVIASATTYLIILVQFDND
ncbi:gustatory receptor 68a-like [Galleria mellonella]|uniref:Gustatory receptor 68a-like n=1 Tax=Galleria mellonella TaxID=7137 RepID=A0A6J3C559_GALME|nr:gustatory receptor 68a-like [Galleria mellonella]